MKHAIGIPATLAALSAALVLPAPTATAAEGCAAPYMTDSELTSVEVGMRFGKVVRVVGGNGVRLGEQSHRGYMVRQWDWCTDGSYDADQWLVFEKDAGRWVLTEIR